MIVRGLRWLWSGYDWPLHKDWLAYIGGLVTIVVTTLDVHSGGPWDLVGAPFTFVGVGWLGGALRHFVRGYREEPGAVDPGT